MSGSEALDALLEQLVRAAPRIGLVLFVLLTGLVLAFVARAVARWLTVRSGLEALGEKLGVAKALYAIGYQRGLGRLIGTLTLWAVLVLTAGAAAELLGLPGIAAGTTALMAYLPRLGAAAFALLGGVWLASVLRAAVGRLARRRDDLEAPRVPGEIVYYAVLVVALTLAAGQAGLETDLVEHLVLVVVTVGALTAGVSFALGSRRAFDHIVLRHYLERTLRPGDRVAVGEHRGTVVRYTAIALVLRTDEGERLIPCARLAELDLVRMPGRDDDEDDSHDSV